MKKNSIIIISIIAIIVVVVGVLLVTQSKKSVKLQTSEDIQAMITTIYSNANVQLPELETMDMSVEDGIQLQAFTGLESNENVETLVVSTPFINAQAYSLAVLKVSNNADVDKMKEEIYNNIDMNKWICVSAEKLYITNHENIIFVIMSSEELAKPVYEEFKKYVGNNVGKELEKTSTQAEDFSIPPAETIVQ